MRILTVSLIGDADVEGDGEGVEYVAEGFEELDEGEEEDEGADDAQE